MGSVLCLRVCRPSTAWCRAVSPTDTEDLYSSSTHGDSRILRTTSSRPSRAAICSGDSFCPLRSWALSGSALSSSSAMALLPCLIASCSGVLPARLVMTRGLLGGVSSAAQLGSFCHALARPTSSSATFILSSLAARCSGVSPSTFRATIRPLFFWRTSRANSVWPCRAARWSGVLRWGVVELRMPGLPLSCSSCFRIATFPCVAALYNSGSMLTMRLSLSPKQNTKG
jgi:hypothetical protein